MQLLRIILTEHKGIHKKYFRFFVNRVLNAFFYMQQYIFLLYTLCVLKNALMKGYSDFYFLNI